MLLAMSFSAPKWLFSSCSSACFCNFSGIIMHLPFIIIPSITALLPLNVHFVSALKKFQFCHLTSFVLCNSFSYERCSSCCVACCISYIDMHSGMSDAVCIVTMFAFMPDISVFLLSSWFCHFVVSWFCIDEFLTVCVEVSVIVLLCLSWRLLPSGLWSVIILTSLAKQYGWYFSSPWSIPNASLSVAVSFITGDRHLLANAIGLCMLLYGTLSVHSSFHLWSVIALFPILWDAFLFLCRGFVSS